MEHLRRRLGHISLQYCITVSRKLERQLAAFRTERFAGEQVLPGAFLYVCPEGLRGLLSIDQHENKIIAQAAFISQLGAPGSGFQEREASCAQCRMAAADLDQLAVIIEQAAVLHRRIPLHALAAVRIAFTIHADLIPVINAGSAHEGELEQRGQLQLILVPVRKRQQTGVSWLSSRLKATSLACSG